MTAPPKRPVVVAFPGPRKPVPPRNLGLTPLSQALGPTTSAAKGHWCDRCHGIWYSHFGEARCPVCGGKC